MNGYQPRHSNARLLRPDSWNAGCKMREIRRHGRVVKLARLYTTAAEDAVRKDDGAVNLVEEVGELLLF